jgi:hypothetical protein
MAVSCTARRLARLSRATTGSDCSGIVGQPQLQVVTFDGSLTTSSVQTDCGRPTLLAIHIDDAALSLCCEDKATTSREHTLHCNARHCLVQFRTGASLSVAPNNFDWLGRCVQQRLAVVGQWLVHHGGSRSDHASFRGNLFVAVVLSCNLCAILSRVRELGDHDDSLEEMTCSARLELAMLVELSSDTLPRDVPICPLGRCGMRHEHVTGVANASCPCTWK